MNNKDIEETLTEQLALKLRQNENDITLMERILSNIKLRNRKALNVIKQLAKEKQCEHIFLELHGHPAALECKKCGKLEKTYNKSLNLA